MRRKYPFVILFGFAIAAAATALVMVVWNYAMPAIFKLPEINFWQTLALLFLSKIFFTSFHGVNHNFRWDKKKHEEWHRRFEEKLANMDPEDREIFMEARRRFRKGWHRRFNQEGGERPGRKDTENKDNAEKE
jgi:hypothetical protein